MNILRYYPGISFEVSWFSYSSM